MQLHFLFIGPVLILVGFLVKSFPNLISGYNTMPEDKKKHVDIKGLSSYMRNIFILMGLLILTVPYLLNLTGLTVIANFLPSAIILSGVTIMVINTQKFYKDKSKDKRKRTTLTYSVLGLTLALVAGNAIFNSLPSKVTFNQHIVKFSGSYGFEMNISEIDTIELTDKIPNVKMKTNGFSLGQVKKGFFNLDTFGKSRLLLHSDTAPFLIISKNNGDKIVINLKDKIETENLYYKIKTSIVTTSTIHP
jgi:hypothetical protein